MMWELHLALGSGVDIVRDTANEAFNVSVGWDNFWEETYQKTNGLWQASIYLSSLVTTLAFLGFSVSFFKSILTNQWTVAVEQYLWVIVVMILLADNGAISVEVIKAMRFIAVEQTQIIYQRTLDGVSIEEALKDVLVTSEVKQQIDVAFRACEIKTGQQQIDCLEDVGDLARQKINEAETRWGNLSGLVRLNERITNTINILQSRPQQGVSNLTPGSILLGSAAQSIVHFLLKLFQFAFAHLFELSLAMTGLYGPIAIALSTLPLPTRFLWFWLQSFLAVAVAIWSYAIMVGIIAWVIVFSGVQTYSDTVFLLLIGVGAPILSWALALGGGTAIWRSMTSAVVILIK